MSGWVFPDGFKSNNDEQDDRPVRIGILVGYLLILIGAMFIHTGLAIMLAGAAIYMQAMDKLYDQTDERLIEEVKKAMGRTDKTVEDLKPQGPPNTEHPEGVQPPTIHTVLKEMTLDVKIKKDDDVKKDG